jgi:hypothetical protein
VKPINIRELLEVVHERCELYNPHPSSRPEGGERGSH